MSTVYILWIRQLKRYIRSRARIIGSLGQPLLFLLALGFGLGPVFQRAGEGNYIEFLAPGVIAMSVLFSAVFSGIDVVWDRQFGFLKETLVAPVSRLYIMIGRTLGGATVASFQGIIVLVISLFIGYRPTDMLTSPLALVFIFLIALMFTALGVAIGSVLTDFQGFQLILNFTVMPLFFISGALFPLQGLGTAFTDIATFDPLAYGVDGLRGALNGLYYYAFTIDFLVLIGLSAVLLAVGSALFSRVEP